MLRLTRLIENVLLLIILISTGCASTEPYHVEAPNTDNCADPSSDQCKRSYYQEHSDYDLAFVEFSERGNVFDSERVDKVLNNIRAHEKETGVVVVTFIHGWKHNAEENDPNLLDFKESLTWIAKNSSSLYGRRLIGLYIGWRGASLDIPWIDNITFWDRKAVAEEVGKGGVTKLLLELDQIDRVSTKNTLVIVGHSFGGAIVVSALTEVLADRAISQSKNNSTNNTIGDGVIVLNPAIEANQALSLVEASITGDFSENNPYFISISSDADAATHYTFPLGQTVGLLLTWHQHDLKRPYYYDRVNGETPALKEEHLDATTVGNFSPYLTHRLVVDSTGEKIDPNLSSCDQVPDQCIPKGFTTLSGHPAMGPLPENYPLYFIKTDETVMKGHNDIFNNKVRTFILLTIDNIMRRSLPTDDYGLAMEKAISVPAPILLRPQDFKMRYQQIYSALPKE